MKKRALSKKNSLAPHFEAKMRCALNQVQPPTEISESQSQYSWEKEAWFLDNKHSEGNSLIYCHIMSFVSLIFSNTSFFYFKGSLILGRI